MIANRVDVNQAEIVKALRHIGASVQVLNAVKQGCPDLLVGIHDRNFLFEVKDGNKTPSQRSLTKSEKDWHTEWRGQVSIVYNPTEAVETLMSLL